MNYNSLKYYLQFLIILDLLDIVWLQGESKKTKQNRMNPQIIGHSNSNKLIDLVSVMQKFCHV